MLGVFGVILTGLPDLLDGAVARQSGRAGPRGAFFDSVADRVSDAALFVGVAWYLAETGTPSDAVLALAVLALSMLISYERARAESLGLDARGGLMERAERFVLLGVGLAFDILVPVLWVMLVLTAFTAVQRFVKVWRQATPERPPPHAPPPWLGHRGAACRQPGAVVGGAPSADRALRRVALRVASSLDATVAAARSVWSILPARSSYFAYRAGEAVARLVPPVDRHAGGPGIAQLGGRSDDRAPRARSSATCGGSTGPTTAAPRCAVTSRPRSTPTGATARAVPAPRRSRPSGSTSTSTAPASSTSRAGVNDGQGRGARAAAPRQLGVRRRVARARRASR